jgi:hypothetical protein
MLSARRLLLLTALVAPPATFLTFCVGSPAYYRDKFSPAANSVQPAASPGAIVPEVQTEPHTCGLHSLSAIYIAYGLDPEALRLRFRLGTDKRFNNLAPSSRGTIHPDMLRVLRQDGFQVRVLFPGGEDTSRRLRDHLDSGHPAVALTKRSELHWVIISGRDGDDAVVCDSLDPAPYRRPLAEYVSGDVYSLMLVAPARR